MGGISHCFEWFGINMSPGVSGSGIAGDAQVESVLLYMSGSGSAYDHWILCVMQVRWGICQGGIWVWLLEWSLHMVQLPEMALKYVSYLPFWMAAPRTLKDTVCLVPGGTSMLA